METTEAPVAQRLPVFEVIGQSYRYAWDQRGNFDIAWLMIITASIISALATRFLIDPAYSLIPIAFNILAGIISMAFHVGLCRRILLRNNSSGLGILCWDRNWRRYFLLSTGLALLCILAFLAPLLLLELALPSGLYAGPAGALAAVASAFFVGHRLILALPAAAIGDDGPFALSWRSTAGNVFRLFAVGFLSFLPVAVPAIVAFLSLLATAMQASADAADWKDALRWGVPLKILFSIFGTWAGTVLATALALSHQRLVTR